MEALLEAPQLSLLHLARGAQLAVRGGAWHEALNAVHHLWCVVWCGVVWCGVVWCGLVWCGVVWCGVVWCGVVWM